PAPPQGLDKIYRHFNGFRVAAQRHAVTHCNAKADSVRQEYAEARQRVLGAARAAVADTQSLGRTGPTALAALLSHVARSQLYSAALVISDGLETASPMSELVVPAG